MAVCFVSFTNNETETTVSIFLVASLSTRDRVDCDSHSRKMMDGAFEDVPEKRSTADLLLNEYLLVRS